MPAQDTRTRASRTATGQRPARRAVLVSDPWTYLPGDVVVPTPAGSLAGGLGALVSRISATLDGEGVVILDARAAGQLGLPVSAGQLGDLGDDHAGHPVLADLRAAGWSSIRIQPWMTIHGTGRPTIHLAILPLISPKDSPVICPMPHDTLNALTIWHERIGSAYYGTPGWAGTSALMKLADAGKDPEGNAKRPTFRPKLAGPEPAFMPTDAYELAYLAESWKGPLPRGLNWGAAYDARMAYLAAASVVKLAPWSLRNNGSAKEYDPKKAGWWLVEFGPWNDKRIPDPAGYGRGEKVRWVTGPTLTLISELVEQGLHGGFEIRDSWTAPIISASNGQPMKIWAERLRDALYSELAGPGGNAARVAIKQSYSLTVGSLNNAKAPIYRPDWHYAVIAMCRVNLWRKMWGIGQHLDRWPLWIETDNVWYPIATNDPIAEAPIWPNARGGQSGMVIGDRLGNVQVKGVRELRPTKKVAGK